jgi:hypothetical protein
MSRNAQQRSSCSPHFILPVRLRAARRQQVRCFAATPKDLLHGDTWRLRHMTTTREVFMKHTAKLPAVPTLHSHDGARLIASCFVLFSMIFTLSWFNAPSVLAQAEPQREDAVGEVVEYWTGTVLVDEQRTNTYFPCPGAWVCRGHGHQARTQEWYLEVQEDGSVSGYIQTELTDFSYEQTQRNNSCGPVAETNYTLNQCQFAGQLSQPNSRIVVQGVREIEEFSGKPILKITSAEETQECQTSWTARGTHSETGATVHKQDTDKCSSGMHVPQIF